MSRMNEIHQRAKTIELLVLDVDGVLTNGGLYFGNSGEELKAFNIKDGMGIKLLRDGGVETAIITGRQSKLVQKRAENLGIQHIIQGREDKLVALDELRSKLNCDYTQIAYMGDDLPDLAAIRKVALGITVADGNAYVAKHAHWQTSAKGGEGAVREACEMILRAQGKLESILESYL